MKISHLVIGGVAAATLAVSMTGCSHKPSSPTAKSSSASATTHGTAQPSSAPAPGTDYTGWLIKATDIDAPITFTAGPPTNNPNGQPGVAITFSTEDGGNVIHDTIRVLADPGAAANALNTAKATPSNLVKRPLVRPAKVGTGGTTLEGNAPDGSKGVTLLMFTEGKAFVTLEFNGPVNSLAPMDFVIGVGQKQDAAVKKGLGG